MNMNTEIKDNEVYIVSYKRTPIGGLQGALSSLSAVELGSTAIRGALESVSLSEQHIEAVFFGNVLSAGIGQAPARQAALGAGVPNNVPCTTVNKVCSSGMKAIALAASAIRAGDHEVIVAGGMESMSNAPYLVPGARKGLRMGNGSLVDSMVSDGLWDPYHNEHMGVSAELCAREHGISREEQDQYAAESYRRAIRATEQGLFDEEMVHVSVPQRKGPATLVKTDEDIYKSDPSKLGKLKSAFIPDGTVTAANASNISDGAAACIVMSGRKLRELGMKPLARIVSYADAAQEPERFTTAPALAVPKALAKAGLAMEDIGYFEVNEAFSVVALANAKLMKVSVERVNVWGGAVSLGHPLGCSGARIVCTLLSVMRHHKSRYGCAGICNGGGGASAIILELC